MRVTNRTRLLQDAGAGYADNRPIISSPQTKQWLKHYVDHAFQLCASGVYARAGSGGFFPQPCQRRYGIKAHGSRVRFMGLGQHEGLEVDPR